MSLKRKRDDEDDYSDEEPSFGKQILPVANLPDTFDGIPNDGMEYLFTVRRDARLLPHVTCVPNPYQKPEPVLPPPTSLETTHPSLPSVEWRALLEIRFRNLRKNAMQPTDIASSSKVRIPELKDRAAWWDFLAGKPESVWNPPKKPKQKKFGRGMRAFNDDSVQAMDYSMQVESETQNSTTEPTTSLSPENLEPVPSKPLAPTPLLFAQIDDRMALHLLMYFTFWMNQHITPMREPFPRPTRTHFQWIFSLLAKVEDHVSADDMNLLRNLVRACIALLKVLLSERAMHAESGESDMDTEAIDQASCWMIIAVVIGIWAQRDLWMDAEDMLKSVADVKVS